MNDLTTLVASTRQTLERIAAEFSPAVFAASLAAADMVLTDLLLNAGLPIGLFPRYTGRLPRSPLQLPGPRQAPSASTPRRPRRPDPHRKFSTC
mgnify:CR=1 FL=1